MLVVDTVLLVPLVHPQFLLSVWFVKPACFQLTVYSAFLYIFTADKAYTDVSKEDQKFSVFRCYLVSLQLLYYAMYGNLSDFTYILFVNYTALDHISEDRMTDSDN